MHHIKFLVSLLAVGVTNAQKEECRAEDCPVQVNTLLQARSQQKIGNTANNDAMPFNGKLAEEVMPFVADEAMPYDHVLAQEVMPGSDAKLSLLDAGWTNVPGALKVVSVGTDPNTVWGCNTNDDIYYRAGACGDWRHISGKLKHVDVDGPNGKYVWGVNSGDNIYFRAGENGNWQHIGGKLKQVSVANNGDVWGVNSGDNIYYRQGVNGNWQHIGGKLKYVSVGGDSGQFVWGVNSNDDIYFRAGRTGTWQHIGGKLMQIEVDNSGVVKGVNSGHNIYTRNGVGGSWHQLGGALKHVAAGGVVWGVNRNDQIYHDDDNLKSCEQADCDGVNTWSGHWMQNGYKGVMDLDLDMKKGEFLVGIGSDSVGEFTIDGEVTNKKIRFTKDYETHVVEYDGTSADGGNSYQGNWTIENCCTDSFDMRPPNKDCITEPPILDGQDRPPILDGQPIVNPTCNWYASAKGDSCDATCAARGSACSADKNSEIDTSDEVLSLIRQVGGDPGSGKCKTGCYYQPGSWKPGKACWYCPSPELRQFENVEENDCAASQAKRQRLCYCCQ